jgi:hypothetical protein
MLIEPYVTYAVVAMFGEKLLMLLTVIAFWAGVFKFIHWQIHR